MGQHLANVKRVLILGNSITHHGPKAEIGWYGDCGMAASSLEKDYSHILLQRFSDAAGGNMPDSIIQNIADFEREHATMDIESVYKKHVEFDADIIILAIGENVPALETQEAQTNYKNAFAALIAYLKPKASQQLFVRGSFWPDPIKDSIMQQVCTAAGGTFIDIDYLAKDASNYARSEREFQDGGVGGHPGDKGMAGIADAIWKAIEIRP